MKTILDFPQDHHAPYPCRYCGAMAVPMTFEGMKPAGIKFLQEYYPNNFFIQSCRCIDDLVDKMEEERRREREMKAIAAEEMKQNAGVRANRKRRQDVY